MYLRYQHSDWVHLMASKLRVAPLAPTRTPRLELMGAILGLRISVSIWKALKIVTREITYWSDIMKVYGRNITEAGHISHLLRTELDKYSLTQVLNSGGIFN